MVEAIMEGRCPRYELDRALDGGYVLVSAGTSEAWWPHMDTSVMSRF
jgi:hypothetical protein